MKVLPYFKKSLLLVILSLTGCYTHAQNKSKYVEIQLNNKAKAFQLSQADLQILTKHNSHTHILKKIERKKAISINEIIELNAINISTDTIISIIDHCKSSFTLTISEIIHLQMEGIPFKVINYMIKSKRNNYENK